TCALPICDRVGRSSGCAPPIATRTSHSLGRRRGDQGRRRAVITRGDWPCSREGAGRVDERGLAVTAGLPSRLSATFEWLCAIHSRSKVTLAREGAVNARGD